MNKQPLLISFLVTFTAAPLILRYILKKRHEKQLLKLRQHDDKSYYQCIFFDYKNFYCKPHLINKEDCGDHCSYTQLQRLLHYIGSAKKTISMCVYMVTLKQVMTELVNASRRGVLVRIVTDKGMGKTTPAQKNLNYLNKNGIDYKTTSSTDEMMHHKYCLIDENDPQGAKAFFGSVNLTAQALCKNFEALILTNNQGIIERLSEEFEELWRLF